MPPHNSVKRKKIYILCGDFNVDLMIKTAESVNLTSLFKSFGGKSIVNGPKRITNMSRTSIDSVFTNIDHCFSMVEVCLFSDHETIYFNVVEYSKTSEKQFIKTMQRILSNDNLRRGLDKRLRRSGS